MRKAAPAPIGLAIIGGGRVGERRAMIAAAHPMVKWIGVAEVRSERAAEIGALPAVDYVTNDLGDLLDRPEVTAVIVATDEDQHVGPVLAAVDRGLPVLIEKPLALDLDESAEVLRRIEHAGVDAVMGYTQRFRQRFMTAKDRIQRGAFGDPTLLSARGFLNRMVSTDMYEGTPVSSGLTPMSMAGTHMIDLALWLLEGRRPVAVQARSTDRVYGPKYGGTDATVSMIEFDDGALCSLVFCWTLPTSWPAAVYSLDIGLVGTTGVLTIDDTHRDIVMATEEPQMEGYAPRADRRVDFLGSYLPGDIALGSLRGPMREETNLWLNRVSMGAATHHATAREGHQRLIVSKAIDLAARTGAVVEIPPADTSAHEPVLHLE
jgi:predicted dehydrogenase